MLAASGITLADEYHLPEQSLDRSLVELAQMSGKQIVFAEELTRDIRAPAVDGMSDLDDTLAALLAGTGLEYVVQQDVIVVRQSVPASEPAPAPGADVLPVADDGHDHEVVVVTGTRLGLEPSAMARQVIVVSHEEMLLTGEPTLARALERLPQNFGGLSAVSGGRPRPGAPQDTVTAANGALNVNAAESISLRGLGDDNTLYLVNGRRRAQAGLQAGSNDISGIPVNAVDRVEIILDGASAIYGSDAVGGVVNIILRDRQDGLAAGLRYGTPLDGGNHEARIDASGGATWSSGNLFAAVSLARTTELTAAEARQFTPFGSPGTVYSMAVGGLSPRPIFNAGSPPTVFFLAADSPLAPVDTSRERLTLATASLTPSTTDFVAGSEPARQIEETLSVVPSQRNLALVATLSQHLGSRWQLDASALLNESDVDIRDGMPPVEVFVPADSPWNPFGEAVKVGSVYPAMGVPLVRSDSSDSTLQAKLSGPLNDPWSVEMTTFYSRNGQRSATSGLWDTAEPAISGNFNPWGDGVAGNDGARMLFDFNCFCFVATDNYALALATDGDTAIYSENRTIGLDVVLRGAALRTTAGDVQIVIGSEGLRSTWDSRADVGDKATGSFFLTRFTRADVTQDQTALFTEVEVPLANTAMALPGARRLSLTGALRFDHFYSRGNTETMTLGGDFASVAATTSDDAWTWSAGIIWSPVKRLRAKANFNTSFSLPKFTELYRAQFRFMTTTNVLLPDLPPVPAYTQIRGGNPDLDPTESRTLGLSAEFMVTPQLQLGLYYHDIEWQNKIVESLIPLQLLGSRLFVETGADPAATMREIARLFPTLVELDANDNLSTLRGVLFNLDSEVARGIDVSLQWDRDTRLGHLSLDATVSRALEHFQRLDIGRAAGNEQLLGIRRPKTRAYLRSSLLRGAWMHAIDVVHTGRTLTDRFYSRNSSGYVTDDLTLVNLQTAWFLEPGRRGDLNLRLGINNVFDTHPRTSYWLNGSKLADTPIGNLRVGDPRGRTLYVGVDYSF